MVKILLILISLTSSAVAGSLIGTSTRVIQGDFARKYVPKLVKSFGSTWNGVGGSSPIKVWHYIIPKYNATIYLYKTVKDELIMTTINVIPTNNFVTNNSNVLIADYINRVTGDRFAPSDVTKCFNGEFLRSITDLTKMDSTTILCQSEDSDVGIKAKTVYINPLD